MERLLENAYRMESRDIHLYREGKKTIKPFVPIEYHLDKQYLTDFAECFSRNIKEHVSTTFLCETYEKYTPNTMRLFCRITKDPDIISIVLKKHPSTYKFIEELTPELEKELAKRVPAIAPFLKHENVDHDVETILEMSRLCRRSKPNGCPDPIGDCHHKLASLACTEEGIRRLIKTDIRYMREYERYDLLDDMDFMMSVIESHSGHLDTVEFVASRSAPQGPIYSDSESDLKALLSISFSIKSSGSAFSSSVLSALHNNVMVNGSRVSTVPLPVREMSEKISTYLGAHVKMFDHFESILRISKTVPSVINYASERIRKDRELIRALVKYNHLTYAHIHHNMKDDSQVRLAVVIAKGGDCHNMGTGSKHDTDWIKRMAEMGIFAHNYEKCVESWNVLDWALVDLSALLLRRNEKKCIEYAARLNYDITDMDGIISFLSDLITKGKRPRILPATTMSNQFILDYAISNDLVKDPQLTFVSDKRSASLRIIKESKEFTTIPFEIRDDKEFILEASRLSRNIWGPYLDRLCGDKEVVKDLLSRGFDTLNFDTDDKDIFIHAAEHNKVSWNTLVSKASQWGCLDEFTTEFGVFKDFSRLAFENRMRRLYPSIRIPIHLP